MLGVIRTRHLLMHAPLIIHEFGFRCFLRCVWRDAVEHRPVTFLECVAASQGPQRATLRARTGSLSSTSCSDTCDEAAGRTAGRKPACNVAPSSMDSHSAP